MPTQIAEITVFGKAAPAGSKRAFRNPRTGKIMVADANRLAAPWKQQVAGAARAGYMGNPVIGPVELELTFVLPRPKSHYRTGKNAGVLKDWAVAARPTSKPDALKLARGVEDALTGILWKDDAQIVEEHLSKVYGEVEQTVIRAWLLNEG